MATKRFPLKISHYIIVSIALLLPRKGTAIATTTSTIVLQGCLGTPDYSWSSVHFVVTVDAAVGRGLVEFVSVLHFLSIWHTDITPLTLDSNRANCRKPSKGRTFYAPLAAPVSHGNIGTRQHQYIAHGCMAILAHHS